MPGTAYETLYASALRLADGAISLSSRLSPLEHQPNIGTFASSMADAGVCLSPACAHTPRERHHPTRGKEVSGGAQEHAAGSDSLEVHGIHILPVLVALRHSREAVPYLIRERESRGQEPRGLDACLRRHDVLLASDLQNIESPDAESLHLKNLLNSQKVSVKPRLTRREVMSGA